MTLRAPVATPTHSPSPSSPPFAPVPLPTPIAPPAPPHTPASGYGVTLGKLRTAREQAREKVHQQDETAPAIEITPENLEQYGREIMAEMTADRAVYQSAVLTATLSAQDNVILISAGVVAHDFLKAERLRLLEFFKKRYRNPEVNVLFELKETTPEKGEKVLSLREIFEKMAGKNPVLRDLRDRLGMDLEY